MPGVLGAALAAPGRAARGSGPPGTGLSGSIRAADRRLPAQVANDPVLEEVTEALLHAPGEMSAEMGYETRGA